MIGDEFTASYPLKIFADVHTSTSEDAPKDLTFLSTDAFSRLNQCNSSDCSNFWPHFDDSACHPKRQHHRDSFAQPRAHRRLTREQFHFGTGGVTNRDTLENTTTSLAHTTGITQLSGGSSWYGSNAGVAASLQEPWVRLSAGLLPFCRAVFSSNIFAQKPDYWLPCVLFKQAPEDCCTDSSQQREICSFCTRFINAWNHVMLMMLPTLSSIR